MPSLWDFISLLWLEVWNSPPNLLKQFRFRIRVLWFAAVLVLFSACRPVSAEKSDAGGRYGIYTATTSRSSVGLCNSTIDPFSIRTTSRHFLPWRLILLRLKVCRLGSSAERDAVKKIDLAEYPNPPRHCNSGAEVDSGAPSSNDVSDCPGIWEVGCCYTYFCALGRSASARSRWSRYANAYEEIRDFPRRSKDTGMAATPQFEDIANFTYIAGAVAILLGSLLFLTLRRRLSFAHSGGTPVVSDIYLRALLECCPEAALIIDTNDLRVMGANVSAELLFGFGRGGLREISFGQLYNKSFHMAVPVHDIYDRIQSALLQGRASFEHAIRNGFGTVTFCEVWLFSLPAPFQDLVRMSCIDISDRKSAQLKSQSIGLQLREVCDAALDVAIIVTDIEGRIDVFNSAARTLFGYQVDEILGRSITELLRIEHRDSLSSNLRFGTGQSDQGMRVVAEIVSEPGEKLRDCTCVRKDGTDCSNPLVLTAIRDGQGRMTGLLGLCYRMDRLLPQMDNGADHQLWPACGESHHTGDLRTAYAQLHRSLEQIKKSQAKLVQSEKIAGLGAIVVAVAHEINTPIGNCVTVASTIHDKTQAFERAISSEMLRKSQVIEYLESVRCGTQILLRGLNRTHELIANFKRVGYEHGDSNRKRFNLFNLVNTAIKVCHLPVCAFPYDLKLDIRLDLELDSYPDALEQLLENLVSNSIIHGFLGRHAGEVRLKAEGSGDYVCMTYSDDGCGMTPEVMGRIFDPFFTTALGQGSSGLGLSICYNLVTKLLGGSIDVDSAPGRGARFIISIPQTAPDRANTPRKQ